MSGEPWWNTKSMPVESTLSLEPGVYWAGNTMILEAIRHNGPTVREYHRDGVPTQDVATLYAALVKCGLRLVYEAVNGFREHTGDIFVWPDGAVSIRRGFAHVSAVAVYTDEETFREVRAVLREQLQPQAMRASEDDGAVFALTREQGELSVMRVGTAGVEVLRTNYSDKTLEAFDHVREDFGSSSPCGRLVVLHGPAGTGKTFMVRGLLGAVQDGLFVLVPSHMVSQLGTPEIIPALTNAIDNMGFRGPTILMVEDADTCLVHRGGDNINTISSLLNMTDGIMGEILNLRVIATANVSPKEIDPAVLRDGRLCRSIAMGALSPADARRAFLGLRAQEGWQADAKVTEKDADFDRATTLAEVYKRARLLGWTPLKPDSTDDGADDLESLRGRASAATRGYRRSKRRSR